MPPFLKKIRRKHDSAVQATWPHARSLCGPRRSRSTNPAQSFETSQLALNGLGFLEGGSSATLPYWSAHDGRDSTFDGAGAAHRLCPPKARTPLDERGPALAKAEPKLGQSERETGRGKRHPLDLGRSRSRSPRGTPGSHEQIPQWQ